jgi:hypothetical protein
MAKRAGPVDEKCSQAAETFKHGGAKRHNWCPNQAQFASSADFQSAVSELYSGAEAIHRGDFEQPVQIGDKAGGNLPALREFTPAYT